MILEQLKIEIDFFNKRHKYLQDVKASAKKYGFANLPEDVKNTFPEDPWQRIKVLYEPAWWLQPKCWFRMLQKAKRHVEYTAVKGVLNGQA